MTKDPAFLFYPGDYLRDTQCLSEAAQVAYDRIMCEHMRSIPVAKDRVNFFTKRLSDSEKAELISVLNELNNGYCIEWLNVSIEKRRAYSESRRENGSKKHHVHMQSIESAQEDENEIVNENRKKDQFNTNDRFEEAWSKYPMKDGKIAARRHFNSTVRSELDFNNLMKAMKNYLESRAVKSGFIKNGSTWFNNWQDWVDFTGFESEKERKAREQRELDIAMEEARKNDLANGK